MAYEAGEFANITTAPHLLHHVLCLLLLQLVQVLRQLLQPLLLAWVVFTGHTRLN
jgi:hypothetical protein